MKIYKLWFIPVFSFALLFLTQSLAQTNKNSSLLARGDWYKIGVKNIGIYKLDYKFLTGLGISENTDLAKIKIYGRAGGMLPQKNNIPRDKDLVQNAIKVISTSGKLDQNSYILFYARGPLQWSYDSVTHIYHHQINYYSDISFYFITANGDPNQTPKRIITKNESGMPNNEIWGFDAYDFHEIDRVTSITTSVKSGREWYGEDFDAINKKVLPNPSFPDILRFDFPNADLKMKAFLRSSTSARSFPNGSSFDFSFDNGINYVQRNNLQPVQSLDDFEYAYAENSELGSYVQIPSEHFTVNIKFNPGTSDALGWLNYIELNVPCKLSYTPGQFSFRSGASWGSNLLNRYHIIGASGIEVWDVTDFHNVFNLRLTNSGNEQAFLDSGNVLREFIACDGSGYYTPGAYGKVANQDIHGLPQPDMVIVTYPDFKPAADSIALYHGLHDSFVVHVVTPDMVYNEFSSGTPDVSAIRDMMKMFYDRGKSIGNPPRFLLLVGAASYDYKDRVSNHTNFVPTYQGNISNYAANSFCTDDYYTMLADGQGEYIDDGGNIFMQICVGRLPVYNLDQAMDIYHKIQRYNSPKSMGNWRNNYVFVADDRFYNDFLYDAEICIKNFITPQAPELNAKKLYLDATPIVSTPAGNLFPQINEAIDQNMKYGTLFMDYIGHGGQLGWAHEKVLTIPMINAWINPYNMPLIITATCQFGTFDDPNNVSAGELALLNPKGGPIALFTTTRQVYSSANTALDEAILNNNLLLRSKSNRHAKYLGQIFIDAKNATTNSNNLNFTLLGDPAIRLALPQFQIRVNNISRDGLASDTFKALSLMTISGEVVKDGKIIKDFNGDIFPTVFDKAQAKMTLGQAKNDPSDPDSPVPFNRQESLIYKGHTSVIDGKFSFRFVVPKDISFTNGFGKLSFYATNGQIDASGYNDSIIVGGSTDNAFVSHKPPMIQLFMNDTNFQDGGITSENPILLAKVKSEVGINTLGSVGHDLLAVLTKQDNTADNQEPVVLNNYYSADKGSYQSGTIAYPYKNLADGRYQLSVKIWDVADNSAEANTDFVVISSSKLTIDKIFNYPNPFIDLTTFQFESNRPNETLNVDLSIFDLRGQMVKNIKADLNTEGTRHIELSWNGTGESGAKLSAGMYVYSLTVKTADGQIAQKSQKLILIK